MKKRLSIKYTVLGILYIAALTGGLLLSGCSQDEVSGNGEDIITDDQQAVLASPDFTEAPYTDKSEESSVSAGGTAEKTDNCRMPDGSHIVSIEWEPCPCGFPHGRIRGVRVDRDDN